MAKVICKVCGTSYQDTADVCPICGNPTTGKTKETTAEKKSSASDKRSSKGGYFSKSNVKKRNAAPKVAASVNAREPKPRIEEEEPQKEKSKGWLLILLLLLAIIGLAAYIGWEYIMPYFRNTGSPSASVATTVVTSASTQATTQATTAASETVSAEDAIPCESISLSKNSVTLANKNDVVLLNVSVSPSDTTDKIVFASSNEKVVKVDANGSVTAIGPGDAIVTITCGDQSVACKVVCTFKDDNSSTATTKATDPKETTSATDKSFSLDQNDVTLTYRGESFNLSVENVSSDSIWWTSSDTSVCTVVNGTVKAIHSGYAEVTATYEGKSDTCIIRCSFADEYDNDEENQSSGGNSENRPDEPVEYLLNHIDVTLYIGDTFTIKLSDTEGYVVGVDFFSNDSSIVTVDGNTVTAVSGGLTTVYCTYEGQLYQCIVRCYYNG